MKILIVSAELIKKDERYLDEKGWSFRTAFERLGFETTSFFYKRTGNFSFLEKGSLKGIWRSYMNKKLIGVVRSLRPDVLLLLKGKTVTPDTLWEIRKKTGTLIVNVFPDNPIYMGMFEAIVPCHYFFVKDTYVLDTLRKAGLKNVFYLPQCTDPAVHRPVGLSDADRFRYGAELSLIGSRYPYRVIFLEQLIEFKPALWGRGWTKVSNREMAGLYRGTDIRGTEKAKAISGTAISLNLHHPLNDIDGVNRRTYDIAGCGGFQLADYKRDMEKVFKVNEEIICYKTIEELKKLIPYYLNHPDERSQIAGAAHERVIKEHTYDHRAKQILEIIS